MNLKFLYFFDQIYIFGNFSVQFYLSKKVLAEFFSTRGIQINFKAFMLRSFLNNNFSIFDLIFFKSSNSFIFTRASKNFLRKYKIRLKTILKVGSNFNLLTIIKKLNLEILNFLKFYSFFGYVLNISNELDIYLYKIVWKFVKRCHPRRSNIWIYTKYWKPFSGVWIFCIFDYVNGKIVFLNSHKISKNSSYFLPLSLNTYDSYNINKFIKCSYKKYKFNFKYFYFSVYERQKGLCFGCNKPLGLKCVKLIDISIFLNKKSNLASNLYLFHSYCNL